MKRITEQQAFNHLFKHIHLIELHQVVPPGTWGTKELTQRINDWKDRDDDWYHNICHDLQIKPLGKLK